MLKDKVILEQYLDHRCDQLVLDNDTCKAIYSYANETYDIPKGMISDLITRRMTMPEANEFILFILLDSINAVLNDHRKIQNVNQFYTDQEVQYYKKSKYKIDYIKFPINFKTIKITDDQWTGYIDVKTLMRLRQAQLINYNINAQRTMQRVVRGSKEIYKITLNNKAVEQIADLFKNDAYVSDTLTLNIPLESDSDFYYDNERCFLVVKSIEHFDIIDGFHRYIAASRVSDSNPDFNYDMEVRITNFSEDKAKQFIYQQDQKTKMSRVDSESMNMNNAANIVVTRLNESIRCNLKGLISRNNGVVNFGELAELVDYFYFKKLPKNKEKSTIVKAVSELTEMFNMITEYNTNYLETKIDYYTLISTMVCFNYYVQNNLNIRNLCEVIEQTAADLKVSNNPRFKNKKPRLTLINEVEKTMKGVMKYERF